MQEWKFSAPWLFEKAAHPLWLGVGSNGVSLLGRELHPKSTGDHRAPLGKGAWASVP